MQVKIIAFGAALSVAPGLLHAQFDFHVAEREVQVHSFASQGLMYSNQNNYMTMKTSSGSFAMTDVGVNISTQITDKFRVGAQIYDRSFGRLSQWHPTLDFAYGDYRLKDWLGIRAGKVKTAMGLYNELQDNQSLYTFAMLPQSVYPTDLRDATVGHIGADLYGNIPIKNLGAFSYTVYGGRRRDTRYGGYLLLLQDRGVAMNDYGGLQYGADLRWTTPIKGLLMGASHMREEITGKGTATCSPAVPINCSVWNAVSHGVYIENSKKDQTNFGYAQYTNGSLTVAGEYRRYWRNQNAWNNLLDIRADTRAWYTSGTYRFSKRLELGGYYSRFSVMGIRGSLPPSFDTSLPSNHLYDKVITARFDLTRFWNFKVEGHFMDGWGGNLSPNGFYTPDNPQGIKPQTNLLIIRTGFSF